MFVSLYRRTFVYLDFVFLYLCAFGLFISISLYFNCLYMEAGRVVFVIYYEMAHLGKCIRVRTECTICVHIVCTLFPSFHQLFAWKKMYQEATILLKPNHLNYVLFDTFTWMCEVLRQLCQKSKNFTMKIKMQNLWHDDLWHLSIWGKYAFY